MQILDSSILLLECQKIDFDRHAVGLASKLFCALKRSSGHVKQVLREFQSGKVSWKAEHSPWMDELRFLLLCPRQSE